MSSDAPNWIKAQVIIDSPESGTYDCFLNPVDRWNGWCKPYFTYEQALAVQEGFPLINPDEKMAYNYEFDRFEISDDYELLEAYSAINVEGISYYPIGNGLWSWFLAEEA